MVIDGVSYPDGWSTWARTHDVVLDALGIDLTVEECELLYHSLPSMLRAEAIEFGFSDTSYAEALHVYVSSNPDLVVGGSGA